MPLLDYDEIHPDVKKNLLIGNGFSIGVSQNFSYNSLREFCQQNNYFVGVVNELFNEFNTNDFEFILNRLDIGLLVNRILRIDDGGLLLTRYKDIRETLIKAVRAIHPNYEDINYGWRDYVYNEFTKFEKIFTTNYDLLIYWVTSTHDYWKFRDYFWNSGCIFNLANTIVWPGNKPVLYLHGNLFIYKELESNLDLDSEEYRGIIKKVTAAEDRLLTSIVNKWTAGAIPIFVSEGNANAKLRSIESDPYLSFAYSELSKIQKGITIFGHSLSPTDSHIVSAINKNKDLKYIAISIYRRNKDDVEINGEIANQTEKFRDFVNRGGNLQFFNSSTCPLGFPLSHFQF